MLVNQTGDHKGPLSRGEQKSLQTDRVILVPGPEEEIETVRLVYERFNKQGKREAEIAAELNSRGIRTDLGRAWTRGTVHQVLTNEKYIGHNVYNRTSFKLKKKHVANPPEMWVRRETAFKPIVAIEDFFLARGILQERCRRLSDEEMLSRLRTLADDNAMLTSQLIDGAEGMPTSGAYRSRFGSLINAYRLAGFEPDRDFSYVAVNRDLRALYPKLVADITRKLDTAGATVTRDATTDLLLINGEYSASMVLSRCRTTPAGSLRWLVRIDRRIAPDITILVRMDAANAEPADYYLLPIMDIDSPRLLLCESNGACLDTYRFDTLDYFSRMASRQELRVAS